ncbi:NUDIX hydrolase [Dethiobacter alkaliphilus]|uniref:NUDIX hydrolase n=1 Tax=Dethiobacter alkaliphilus AHT 1 TaxID=555088 RepID=C0GHN5_DETAL|nr:NUDIX domain-containing protein [Dethiobacter alkaliphilus]EEG77241.1 NUDIX hydrolase [Dethiobacter alkaliphilus AHT 1]MCW3489961.1 NUDIX domain-containing protein [Dethiobacter alkaliphilus]
MTVRCIMVFLYKWQNGEPRYLLLKRNPKLGGYWQPVTGFIDEPETNRHAALRELTEETGIEEYERVTDPNHYFFFDMNGTSCSVSVLAVEVTDPPEIEISFEHTECKWLSYEEARQTLYWENNVETLDKLHQQLLAQGKH